MKLIRFLIQASFCLLVLAVTLFSKSLADPKAPAELTRNLLNGTEVGFPIPGSELEPLKKLLPTAGAISFISDKPFGVDLEVEKFYHDAQNYLCPLILNPEPGEEFGLAMFSSSDIANERLAAIHYAWIINWGNTKGIIRKNA